MTEREWLRGTDSERMLEFVKGKASCRKSRLFACACCRRIWHLMGKKTRQALEVAERFLEREASAKEMLAYGNGLKGNQYFVGAVQKACVPTNRIVGEAYWSALSARLAAARAEQPDRDANLGAGCIKEEKCQVPLLRDIFGNPFRPVSVDPAWLRWDGGTIPKLARAAYDERLLPSGNLDPARLAVLADALEDAGCADADILGHLRGPGPHVRGCWLVDLILGKV